MFSHGCAQEDHLQHLALFTEYGRVAHSKSHPSGAEAAPETEGRSAVFQRVEFLVRDSPELEGLDEDVRSCVQHI